jgi:hypothetical protein
LEEAGEKLRLAAGPIWHAVQVLNILENFGSKEINGLICRSWSEAQCFVVSLLDLTAKLDRGAHLKFRDYARAAQPHNENCSQYE